MRLTTKNGYAFFDVTSAMQKAIRRADIPYAGWWAHELLESGYYKYVWTRLLVISAEDCADILTAEIESLQRCYMAVRDKNKPTKGRIFLSKAVILLCKSDKSRDADHLQNYCRDHMTDVDTHTLAEQIEAAYVETNSTALPEIPQYAYDVHTSTGKRMGKNKEQFFREEQEALKPVSATNALDHYAYQGSPEQLHGKTTEPPEQPVRRRSRRVI